MSPDQYDCAHVKQVGALSAGPIIRYDISCSLPAEVGNFFDTSTGTVVFQEPPCQRERTGQGYPGLSADMKAKLTGFFNKLDQLNACYRFTLGYRSERTQQKLYDDWHRIADSTGSGDHRTAAQIDQQLRGAGFAQNVPVTNNGHPARNANGVARGGPCAPTTSPCRHVAREAADIRWWWRPFGEDPFRTTGGEFQHIFSESCMISHTKPVYADLRPVTQSTCS